MNPQDSNLSMHLADLKALRLEMLPLENHSLVNFDSHIRETYATQLATLMLINDLPSEDQTTLFCQLLESLQLDKEACPRILQQAQQTNKQSIREFLTLVAEHQFEASFIVDGFVLCRLDAPLTTTQSQVFSEYTQLMKVQEPDLKRYVHLASQILGLPSDYQLPSNYDFAGAKLSVWKAFFYRELTQAMLDQKMDLDYGLWTIKGPLVVKHPLIIRHASIHWHDDAITPMQIEEKTLLVSCYLYNPRVECSSDISLSDSDIQGDYPIAQRVTAFTLLSSYSNFEISRSSVVLKNARVMKVKSNDCKVNVFNSTFEYCGHPDLSGGVFLSINPEGASFIIKKSEFSDCIAKRGAIICANYLYGDIKNSKFNRCFSKGFNVHNANKDPDGYKMSSSAITCNSFDFRLINNSFFYTSVYLEIARIRSFVSIETDLEKASRIYIKNKISNSFVLYSSQELSGLSDKNNFTIAANDFGCDLFGHKQQEPIDFNTIEREE